MLLPSFGQTKARDLEPVRRLMDAMKESDKKKLNSIETQLLLRELYDDTFRIAYHNDPHNPLSLVAKHPKETLGAYSRLYRTYFRFASLGVGDMFKISVDDFLNQPREMVEMMFTIAENKATVKSNEDKRVLDKIENSMRDQVQGLVGR